jgi:N-acetyl-gamma-glutamyl-phosphate reductase
VTQANTIQATPGTAVVGITGYAGAELARLLLHHPRFQTTTPLFLGRGDSQSAVGLTSLHPQLKGSRADGLQVEAFSWKLLEERGIALLFLATPHEQSREWVPEAMDRGIRVIDLSGAWRLQDESNRAIYKFEDASAETAARVQAETVYGMPELHRGEIQNAQVVANPGCYATSIILALKPLVAAGLVDLSSGVIADAKSGVSGAGKAATAKTHFMYAADNLSAYGLFGHRHLGELLEQLDVSDEQIVFTPHLLPIPRGILSTIYVRFVEPQEPHAVAKVFGPAVRNAGAAADPAFGADQLLRHRISSRVRWQAMHPCLLSR